MPSSLGRGPLRSSQAPPVGPSPHRALPRCAAASPNGSRSPPGPTPPGRSPGTWGSSAHQYDDVLTTFGYNRTFQVVAALTSHGSSRGHRLPEDAGGGPRLGGEARGGEHRRGRYSGGGRRPWHA